LGQEFAPICSLPMPYVLQEMLPPLFSLPPRAL
jgi:hypothetical protein